MAAPSSDQVHQEQQPTGDNNQHSEVHGEAISPPMEPQLVTVASMPRVLQRLEWPASDQMADEEECV